MKVNHYEQIPSQPVTMDGASGCRVRWLVDENDGAPNFAMRQFEVAPAGFTPRHAHPYEHEVFVIDGEGVVAGQSAERPLKSGDVVFIPPNETHQFRNTGDRPLKFLCLVPNASKGQQVTIVPECGAEPSR